MLIANVGILRYSIIVGLAMAKLGVHLILPLIYHGPIILVDPNVLQGRIYTEGFPFISTYLFVTFYATP
jgi:hypothetical protein